MQLRNNSTSNAQVIAQGKAILTVMSTNCTQMHAITY